ncbi:TPA: phage protein NinX family protein [Providencia alcalifaciens]
MNKYTELSDFEINKKVADLIGATPYPYGSGGYHSSAVSGMESAIIIKSPHKVGAFDPCNNPSDAMPIIIENRIAIFPMETLGVKYWCAASDFEDIGEKEIIWGIEANNKSPYRAAMEVYLLVKDAENEKV